MPSITVDGVSIGYEDTGRTGVPVVLVHAWPLNAGMWSDQAMALEPRRVVAVDLMGFGRSDAPDDPTAYSMDVYARQVAAVIESLGGEAVVLGGLSLGGYVSFALLRSAPHLAAALVLADTRAEPDTPENIAKRTRQQAEVRAGRTAELIDEVTATLPSKRTLAEKPEAIARIKELMDNPPAGIVGALEALKTRPDSRPLLPKIAVPTLVVVGEDDAVTPVDTARALSEAIPRADLAVIPESGHLSNLEAPDAFNDALVRFLSGL